ncbi:hypothetical protein RHO13_06395 [Orbus wheelerorum]|uniref:hypothetical protein n=1 Tax=Orbus wheelerorum TaxID=3074111 RepID=UPI00370D45EE
MTKANARLLIIFIMCNLLSFIANAQTRVIHVVVALCDNKYQQIVPVPKAIGNGQDPKNNLYWGAQYGFKTYFAKQKEWKVIQNGNPANTKILEQIIYKHSTKDIYIIAEAYDGKYINNAIDDFFTYSSGNQPKNVKIDNIDIKGGGNADLVVYIGHDALMEWSWTRFLPNDFRWESLSNERKQQQQSRYAAVFACQSQQYFSPPLSRLGITPLILTTQNMAPEAYSVYAMIDGFINHQSKIQIRQKVATAYSKYQKLSKPVLSLFVTEYQQ